MPPSDTTAAITAQASTQCKSWRTDGSPSCLGGSSHGCVPVETHSTPVPTSVGRLWVAHQQHTSDTTQRAQMTTRGGHCPNMVAERVSDPRNSTRLLRSPRNKTSVTVSQRCRRPPVPRRVRRIGPSCTGMSTTQHTQQDLMQLQTLMLVPSETRYQLDQSVQHREEPMVPEIVVHMCNSQVCRR